MAIVNETQNLGVVLRVRTTGALDSESLTAFDQQLNAAVAQKPGILLLSLGRVRPLDPPALARVVARARQLRQSGGRLYLVLPAWLGGRGAGVVDTLTKQGIRLFDSEGDALRDAGLPESKWQIDGIPASDPGGAEAEVLPAEAEETDEGSYLADLQDGIAFYLSSFKATQDVGSLEESDLENVAGGASGEGGKGLMSELKAGLRYWMGKD